MFLAMGVVIRPIRDGDVDAIVALSVRAWEPVFESIHETVGPRLFVYFYERRLSGPSSQ